MTSKWLDPLEDRAWRGFRRMFTLLEAQLARELAEDSELSSAEYTVLSNLVDADERRCRISDLAERMQWSQSRLSHQLRRMTDRGLVVKRPSPDDGRGAVVELTREGLRAVAAAAPGHMAGVHAHMLDLLSREQLEALAEISSIVVSHLDRLDANLDAPV